ncbi:MAG: helix-turn-helix domain-containing protein [Cyclobacteriaceae bacterium]|nr:helix-turn-helix domain-containing protein [Cyclobacteriaceae bacterium]
MPQLNLVLQIATATLLGLVCLLLARHSRSGLHTWTGIGFAVSILCYMIVESDVIQSVLFLRIAVSIGAISIPVFFWLLARAIFDDHFVFRWSLIIWFLIILIPHLNFFVGEFIPWTGFRQITSIVAHLMSLGFVLAGLYTALRTRHGDLVDSRIRFRNVFLSGTAALIGVTLIVELIPIHRDTIIVLQVLQRLGIFVITLFFLLSNFGLHSGFFFREVPKPKPPSAEDPQLSTKLQALMEEQKVYKKEGLTIGLLAELMAVQEYRLRRLINGQLGFRNFNDFLNQYRVNEACEILSDPAQARKTILEIAYDLGYQSIGPFNKAFKDLKGTTPTAYRKGQVA